MPLGPVYALIDRATPAIQEGLRRGQPNIFLPLDRLGVDPFRQRFPVSLRYEGTVRGVGGLLIDREGATSVPGLYAAGDAASREPVVGAVSGGGGPNSTWAIASGVWAGRSAAAHSAKLGAHAHARRATPAADDWRSEGEIEIADACIGVAQAEMFPLDRNFTRDETTLRGSLDRLDDARRTLRAAKQADGGRRSLRRTREAIAMVSTGRWIYASALQRRETRASTGVATILSATTARHRG